ncbi:MAG: hypothetical protein R3236_00560 [Phycisphaeraceae bacterium]|nr:hypothetical protein [Phycisphaeraceae bacterium]
MTTVSGTDALGTAVSPNRRSGTPLFALLGILLLAGSAAMAGWMPIGFAIGTVFLFAGPHNWFEVRYFLSRMPARWGSRRVYFSLGLAGVILLSLGFIGQSIIGRSLGWSMQTWSLSIGIWNTCLLLWVAAMVHLRGRERAGRDWSWIWAVAFALIAVVWARPLAWDLFLIYLHPVIALCFCRHEIKRRKPHWLRTFDRLLLCIPLILAVLWWQLAQRPDLGGPDALNLRITQLAGMDWLDGVSSHFLVASHTFLEVLHYGVWILAIPMIGLGRWPWQLQSVPLAKKSARWRCGLLAVVVGGGLVTVALWAGFMADYPLTRDIYFTAAIVHVLAEFPFLIRSV